MNRKFAFVLSLLLCLISGVVAVWAQERQPAPEPRPATPPHPPMIAIQMDGGNFLGVRTEDITRENMNRYNLSEPRGVGVTEVVADSPASRAGLRTGDVILRFDDEQVTSARKLVRLIGEAAPEQNVRLTISRAGAEQQIAATLAARRATHDRLIEVERALGEAFGREGERVPLVEPGELFRRMERIGPEIENFSMTFGTSRRIGITTTPLTDQLANHFGVSGGRGLLITSVAENSPAARAGLRAGDVLTQIDGNQIGTVTDLVRGLSSREEGDVRLTVVRERNAREIRVTPERREEGRMLETAPGAPPARMRVAPPTRPRTPSAPEVRQMRRVV